MPPKTAWGNPTIEILNGDNYEPLGIITGESLLVEDDNVPSGVAMSLARITGQTIKLTGTINMSTEAMFKLIHGIEVYWAWRRALPARRVRTGITPKRGRSRRKQRLTRLQRRQKRQRR